MIYATEVANMTCLAKGPDHGPAPIPQEGRWTQAKEIEEYKAAALRMVERRASLPEAQLTKLMTAIAQQSQATEPKAAKEEGRIPSRFSRAPDVREERTPARETRPAASSM